MRLMMILTGRPAFATPRPRFEVDRDLPPKPPPISHGVTDTCDTEQAQNLGGLPLHHEGSCVLVQI
jgi:hypothetical protein